MDLTTGAHTLRELWRLIENDNLRSGGKYPQRTRAIIFIIGLLLAWGAIFLFVWSIF